MHSPTNLRIDSLIGAHAGDEPLQKSGVVICNR